MVWGILASEAFGSTPALYLYGKEMLLSLILFRPGIKKLHQRLKASKPQLKMTRFPLAAVGFSLKYDRGWNKELWFKCEISFFKQPFTENLLCTRTVLDTEGIRWTGRQNRFIGSSFSKYDCLHAILSVPLLFLFWIPLARKVK